MLGKKKPNFIDGAGGCIVSKNILDNKGNLKWLLREESVNDVDNGWRFFSDIDNDEFINNPKNMTICDFNTVAEIEPAVIGIYHFPIGSDLQLIVENNRRFFLDNLTGKVVEL
ncbi:DUF2185 domain-containing protein [Aneurinibacillus aneurinilyticus]|jgi:hypothetical protein|uniref:Immunity protein Imm33 domain-containing protein n=1 Tax=Aneurinibacillus aneurinilyticus ATCC 12856 TaxID=649747 RepID=U1WNT3_ANEAE|nr:DUF2185 domain-containing protein [Aneurinibacillus aneurinilyticus]ERI10254.1 hypothetical protein HMPREF0083_01654 [Aneurinibacillus aneurinilyticus ATCC 12856]MED0709783.1 DUF2185 domain-containing protein [Aneurinibacillus aneurinilyticus]MED0726151.1 DUF2185 domain-containing protein [Aneurinibacillus aneurinilyticus]MED0735399.1 DUF2185 domain-containing protein [Aneurinibacillus aneurinilyticus]MED0744270.1 DUF2185 domain-containing protein [Aneurinibacillus aneurinilyticus]